MFHCVIFWCGHFLGSNIVSQSRFNLKIRVTLGPLVSVCNQGVPILYHESESIPISISWVHVYTMSPCLYHESLSIPWVHIYTMSPCLYHESMFLPWVHVYTKSTCLYHESMSIPWVLVNSMSPCLYHVALPKIWVSVYNMSPGIKIKERRNKSQKYTFQIYRGLGMFERRCYITCVIFACIPVFLCLMKAFLEKEMPLIFAL